MRYIETDNIIRIPIELTLSTKTWKMTIKKEFNGKMLKDTIQTTRDGEIKSCKLDNIYTITEYIALKQLKENPITDEQIEAGIEEGIKSILQQVLNTVDSIEASVGKLPQKWQTDAYVILTEEFATAALEISLKDFLSLYPEGKEQLSENVFKDISSIVIGEAKLLIMLIGQDDEILSASIDEDYEVL